MTSETAGQPEYSLLPLKNHVLYPGVSSTVLISQERAARTVTQARNAGAPIVVAALRNPEASEPGPGDLYAVGTLAEIRQIHQQSDNNAQVVLQGLRRVRLRRMLTGAETYQVEVADFNETDEPREESPALIRHTLDLFERYTKLQRNASLPNGEQLRQLDAPGPLADLLASRAAFEVGHAQTLLEIADGFTRLEQLSVTLTTEIEILELEGRIRNRIRQQMDKNQREYYLKEQLKAIHEELGSDHVSEVNELRERIAALNMPEDVRSKALREVQRLERMAQASPEANVVRTYLEVMLSLPWSERTADRLDIDEAQDILDADHFGLEKVKERIIEFLAVRQLIQQSPDSASIKSPILCLVGPPGVGKTSLGRSIARSLGRKFVRLSLGGVRDEADIRGHRRTYIGALPGRIIQGMRTAGSNNPVMLLDEVDKMTSDFRGDPTAALLEVLDPEQNHTFTDHYLEAPFDLSDVMFIATANLLWHIPRPLADRMEVIELPGYTEDEKVQIARRFLLPKQLKQHGLRESHLELTDRTLRLIIRLYTREAGVRNLERQLATVCRKLARQVLKDENTTVRLSPNRLRDYLGTSRSHTRGALEEALIGVATGLAWTEHGGELLPVEVATMTGKGAVTVTGRLGEVMQESARAAVSYARARAEELRIDRSFLDKTDLHIHLPEGAIPKDGPSAGITICTALVSALTRRPVRNDIAMTGEITLRGRVLPIGGLKEKVLAAARAGIKYVVAPEENKRDLHEIPKSIRGQVEFIWVEHMDQVLSRVFVAPAIELPRPLTPEPAVAAAADGAEGPLLPPTADLDDSGVSSPL